MSRLLGMWGKEIPFLSQATVGQVFYQAVKQSLSSSSGHLHTTRLPVSLVPKDYNKPKGPDKGKHEQWDTGAEEPTLDSSQTVL